VLEILLAARGHRVATDRLAGLLWRRQRPKNAAGSLQTFVSALRRHLHGLLLAGDPWRGGHGLGEYPLTCLPS